jgi:tetratricopeptide (TPR) repeat protein
MLGEGQRQEQGGNLEAARQSYRKALELEPCCSEAWQALAASHARAKDWANAQAACIKGLQALSDMRADGYDISAETAGYLRYELAQVYRQQGRLDDAIIEFKLAIHYHPNHERSHHELGVTCWEEGRLEEALCFLARALTLNYAAEDTLSIFQKALAQSQAQEAQKFPQTVRDSFNAGFSLYSQQKFAEALPHFQTALKTFPNHAESLSYQGLCQLMTQDPAGLSSAERAAQIAPNNADVLRNLALCYAIVGRLDDAAHLYRRAIEIRPTCVAAYMELGKLCQHQKRWDEAFQALRRARYFDQEKTLDQRMWPAFCESWVQAEPENARSHYELALCYLAAGNWSAVVAELTAALSHGLEQTRDIYVYFGLALMELKDWNRAIQSLKTAVAQQPGHSLSHAMLAYAHFVGLKNNAEALHECELATRYCSQQAGTIASSTYRRMVMQMMSKIQHPSRADQTFWATTRRQIKSEVTYGI